jgi:hypothetical protein
MANLRIVGPLGEQSAIGVGAKVNVSVRDVQEIALLSVTLP